MRSDVFLFLGIIFLIFIVWIATGGPSRPISFAGPYILPLAAGASPEGYSLSHTATSSAGAGTTQSTGWASSAANTASSVRQDLASLQKAVVSSVRFGTPSPYKGAITIRHSIGGFSTDDPDNEYISLSAGSKAGTGVDITGWKIYSEARGYSETLPHGVNLAHTGVVNAQADIMLASGQTAMVITGDSPVGFSFRTNMCTGYLDEFQTFTPTLAHSCPAPSSEFDRFYLGNQHSLDACEAYIKTVPRCTIPTNEPSDLADDCYHFIDRYLNYNGCVDTHAGDTGFFGNEWRIYLHHDEDFFTKDHDTVKLLDQNGLTVDLISY